MVCTKQEGIGDLQVASSLALALKQAVLSTTEWPIDPSAASAYALASVAPWVSVRRAAPTLAAHSRRQAALNIAVHVTVVRELYPVTAYGYFTNE